MLITEAIQHLKSSAGDAGITFRPGADDALIELLESSYNITLPEDFKTFYRFTNGFETDEDLFNMISIDEMIKNKKHYVNEPLYIAEYMIYSDMWRLEINPENCNDYKIIVDADYNNLVLTHSLGEFFTRFLKGGVFESGGLYEWQEEVQTLPIYNTKLKTAELLLTFFYYGLWHNIISKKEIIDWASRIVTHENEPESLFIDLSNGKTETELLALLKSVHVPESGVVARAFLGLIYRLLSADTISVHDAIAIIDTPTIANSLTQFERGQIDYLDILTWRDDITIEDSDLKQRVLTFLTRYKEFEVENYKSWFNYSIHIEYKLATDEEKFEKKYSTNKTPFKVTKGMWYIIIAAVTIALVIFNVYIYFESKNPPGSLGKFSKDLQGFSLIYFSLLISYNIVLLIFTLLNRAMKR